MDIDKNLEDIIYQEIVAWEKMTNNITETFLYDYFDDVNPYYFWVSDEVGGILNYGDYWFNFSDILTCYKLSITEEQLLNWYSFCMENNSVNISLAKFILSSQEKKEQEEKHLEELKDRVRSAEETLKQALEKYEK